MTEIWHQARVLTVRSSCRRHYDVVMEPDSFTSYTINIHTMRFHLVLIAATLLLAEGVLSAGSRCGNEEVDLIGYCEDKCGSGDGAVCTDNKPVCACNGSGAETAAAASETAGTTAAAAVEAAMETAEAASKTAGTTAATAVESAMETAEAASKTAGTTAATAVESAMETAAAAVSSASFATGASAFFGAALVLMA